MMVPPHEWAFSDQLIEDQTNDEFQRTGFDTQFSLRIVAIATRMAQYTISRQLGSSGGATYTLSRTLVGDSS